MNEQDVTYIEQLLGETRSSNGIFRIWQNRAAMWFADIIDDESDDTIISYIGVPHEALSDVLIKVNARAEVVLSELHDD